MEKFVIVRGAGDLATGTIAKLVHAGCRVLVLESPHPAAIRRTVSLCEAVYRGTAKVEDVTARLVEVCAECLDDDLKMKKWKEIVRIWDAGEVPILVDPRGLSIGWYHPDVVVDAIIAKKKLGTKRNMAPCTIALGPGFVAGEDVDVVIETKRGHNLGRIIREGPAYPNSGIPGVIAGYGKERVMHSPAAGVFHAEAEIGDIVECGAKIACVETDSGAVPIEASLSGLLRGILRDGYPVTEGFKVADIDPRKEELQNCYTISDKSRCIAGGVLEAVMEYFAKK